jgi:hypothetical protein
LNRKPAIQKSTALLLLLVFAISIAPKAWFHDLIANHKDSTSCHQVHKAAVLHVKGYNCHFDDLVVSAPFLLQQEQPVVLVNFYPREKQTVFSSSFYSAFIQHKENRGPPAV